MSTGLDDLTPELARHILDRMGSTGQPPERGAHLVNVATGGYLDVLRDEYLRPMRESRRNSTFKLVQAPFGGGKTHFLHCLRELAWSEGFATALVGLSPKECPFDRPVSIYREVALRLELPVDDFGHEPAQGLDVVLRQIARRGIDEHGAGGFRAWLRDELANAPIESRAFGRGVRAYLAAVADGDEDTEELVGDWLRGDAVEARALEPLRLRERLEDANAFRWLRSLVQTLAALGLPGVVLLFDEMDRNMSLSAKRRQAIGDNLRQMIDYCGQSLLPGVVWCYAVPPEFMDTIVPEYPALAQRLKGAALFSDESPLQPVIDLDRLPLGPIELLRAIGERLLELAELGWDHRFDRAIQTANLGELARELGERQFESGTRRQFVKAAASLIETQRRTGDRALTPAEIQRYVTGSVLAQPDAMPGETEL